MPQPQLLVCVREKPALSPVSATLRSERRSRCTRSSSSAPALGAAASASLSRAGASLQGSVTGKFLSGIQGTASGLPRSGDIPWETQRVPWSRPGTSRAFESARGSPPGRRRPSSLAARPPGERTWSLRGWPEAGVPAPSRNGSRETCQARLSAGRRRCPLAGAELPLSSGPLLCQGWGWYCRRGSPYPASDAASPDGPAIGETHWGHPVSGLV